MSLRFRLLLTLVVIVLLGSITTRYVQLNQVHTAVAGNITGFTLDRPGQLIFRAAPAGPQPLSMVSAPLTLGPTATPVPGPGRRLGSLRCQRFHAAGGTGVCLRLRPGPVALSEAVILDARLHELRRIKLVGVPTRARVSASGRMVAWTTFITGDSYAASGFSTRTGILDTRTGTLITSIETIPLWRDGRRYYSADVNYWGVTFAADDNHFYATVATKNRTYLIDARLDTWQAHIVRENVECPSLSPDGRRIAFKQRVSGGTAPWRLAVLDLATGRETALPATNGIDDQALWIDRKTLAYAAPAGRGRFDIYTTAADGRGRPRLLVSNAVSPTIT